MNLRDWVGSGHQSYLGDHPRQVVFGSMTTVALFAAGVFFDGLSQAIGTTGLVVVALAGFLTGASLGRKWYEGVAVAFRAVVIGLAVSALAVTVGLLVLWLVQPEGNSMYGALLSGVFLMVLGPLFGFVGAVGGGVGTVLRRFVVPPGTDPPTY
ncbi:hypothetical protein C475_12380 [Halosimplex carlsbadense 2-9-1]|uniref:Uncharacterized protein n=1 Tax=Halosimplex carlsbadense 2-9-1 TaxID=797114 RepID=M0CMT5_9EURY|nr:hypothetical protein [Halosimplex carlsbadense]ELZ24536.1 hypothetical protein C475_12380 [Halosimplex carlsbadense 2-9-1]